MVNNGGRSPFSFWENKAAVYVLNPKNIFTNAAFLISLDCERCLVSPPLLHRSGLWVNAVVGAVVVVFKSIVGKNLKAAVTIRCELWRRVL